MVERMSQTGYQRPDIPGAYFLREVGDGVPEGGVVVYKKNRKGSLHDGKIPHEQRWLW